MFHYSLRVLQKYAEFNGRARRAEYWYFALAVAVFGFVFSFLFIILGMSAGFHPLKLMASLEMVTIIMQLGLLIPSIAVGVRRLHDSNKSGWWLLLPLYNLYLLTRPGTVGENFYGPDPKASEVPVPLPVPPPPPPGNNTFTG